MADEANATSHEEAVVAARTDDQNEMMEIHGSQEASELQHASTAGVGGETTEVHAPLVAAAVESGLELLTDVVVMD